MSIFGHLRIRFSKERQLLNAIKNIFGFIPGNIFVYKQAFRHKSVASSNGNGSKDSNERLEYLGDAILSAVVAEYLFKRFPYRDEGFLTEMRSKIVSRNQLNKLSEKLGLSKLIKSHCDHTFQNKSIQGNALEAFIGALFMDKGYAFTKSIIIRKIITLHLDIDTLEHQETNFKSKLIEFAQKEKKNLEYRIVEEVGQGHHKQYVVEVVMDQAVVATGRDFSIKKAEQNASENFFSQKVPPTANS